MREWLEPAANVAVLVFVVAGMAAAGLGLRPADVVASLGRGRLVLAALAANFVIAPAVAVAMTAALPLDRPYAAGLLLLSSAAGAPFLPRLAGAVNGDAGFAVGLMLVLTVGSVVFMPLALPVLVPGLSADPWAILRPLLVTMVFPLGGGAVVRAAVPRWAGAARRCVSAVGTGGMIVAVVLLLGLNGRAILGTAGTGAVAAGAVFVAATFAAGYALGGGDRRTRAVLGLGTGQRNVAAALVAARSFDDSRLTVMILATTFAGLAVLLAAARLVRTAGPPTRGLP